MITLEAFTELAHRTASRYSHRSEPDKAAYTFLPHTLEAFHRQVCEAMNAQPVDARVHDAKKLLSDFACQAHRMGELFERCQGKGWPNAESAEFSALRDGKEPATRAALLALLSAAPQPVQPTTGPLGGKYGDVLAPFVALMEAELHANSQKGDRPGWLSMSANTALLEIYWHTAKLSAAVKNNDGPAITEHSADVANMAMMLLDVCGGLHIAQAKPEQAGYTAADVTDAHTRGYKLGMAQDIGAAAYIRRDQLQKAARDGYLCEVSPNPRQDRVPIYTAQPGRVPLGADRLAAAVARLVSTRTIDARSEAADALLDYLDIGGVCGPADVPTWLRQYEAAHNITRE